jgi:hypothetical protein
VTGRHPPILGERHVPHAADRANRAPLAHRLPRSSRPHHARESA